MSWVLVRLVEDGGTQQPLGTCLGPLGRPELPVPMWSRRGGASQSPMQPQPQPGVTQSQRPLVAPWDPPRLAGLAHPRQGEGRGPCLVPPMPPCCHARCTLYPHTGTFLVHRENIKHTANTLLSLNRLRWADPSRPMPSQSPSNGSFGKTKGPGFIAECDGTWHGVPSLVKLGRLSLLGPLPASRPTAQPARSGTRREKQRKPWRSASAVPHQRKRWCVFNTV